MGLDMYVSAQKRWSVASEQAQLLMKLRDATPEQLDPANEDWDKTYLSTWAHAGPEVRENASAVLEAAGLLGFRTDETGSGSMEVIDNELIVGISCIYWRKANAVHAWFVDNVQEGTDDCGEYPVHVEQLAMLRELCQKGIAAYDEGDIDKAAQILTPVSGFFFGSTDIDDWWREDLVHTVNEIERVIKTAIEVGGVTFSYHSSW